MFEDVGTDGKPMERKYYRARYEGMVEGFCVRKSLDLRRRAEKSGIVTVYWTDSPEHCFTEQEYAFADTLRNVIADIAPFVIAVLAGVLAFKLA